MGQRSQIYINVNKFNKDNLNVNEAMVASYFQWNYGARMVSRARGIIDYVKEISDNGFYYDKEMCKKLSRIAETNFDMKDVVLSDDILKEAKEYGDKDIFAQDNNDGMLLVSDTEDGIKYAFIYDGYTPLTAEEYLKADLDEPDMKHIKAHLEKYEGERACEYTLDNIKAIEENATLMTQEEVIQFMATDYSKFFDSPVKYERVDELVTDREKALEMVERSSSNLKLVDASLKADKDFILEAVQKDGMVLQFVSPSLRNDKDVVFAAVQQNSNAFLFTSAELHNDKDVVLEAVKQNGDILRFAPDELKDDKDVVMAAVKNEGFALDYASDKMQNDKDIVLTAVSKNGNALQVVSPELRDDVDIVRAAVKQNGWAINYASQRIQANPSLLEEKPSLDSIIKSAQNRASQGKAPEKESPTKDKSI